MGNITDLPHTLQCISSCSVTTCRFVPSKTYDLSGELVNRLVSAHATSPAPATAMSITPDGSLLAVGEHQLLLLAFKV